LAGWPPVRDLEGDQGAAAIGGDQAVVGGGPRRADIGGGVRQSGQGPGHLPGSLLHERVMSEWVTGSAGLDQHVLHGGRGHAQPVQGLLGPPRLAGVVAGQAVGAQRLPGRKDHGNQRPFAPEPGG
jgi:hypothetical protein